ncbi:MAG: CpsD/CapB family tyrosine-protein kinase [Pseudomonadota bacterium]
MTDLKEALDRARREHKGSIGKSNASQTLNPVSAGRVSTSSVNQSAPAGQEATRFVLPARTERERVNTTHNFSYQQTRVVELDKKWLEQNRVIAGNLGDKRVEAYRQLRTQILHTLSENNWNTLAITSPMKDAGKTLTAVNIAISLAQEIDKTVLLVDLDLSMPNVHTTLGVNVEHGLSDIISGDAAIRDVLFNPGIERLTILPGRPLVDYSSELLTAPAMKNLLQDIKSRYQSRIVIFDLPPLLRNDDALKFTPYADATLMVVEAGVNSPEEIERSMHLLRNANLIGTILNKAKQGV